MTHSCCGPAFTNARPRPLSSQVGRQLDVHVDTSQTLVDDRPIVSFSRKPRPGKSLRPWPVISRGVQESHVSDIGAAPSPWAALDQSTEEVQSSLLRAREISLLHRRNEAKRMSRREGLEHGDDSSLKTRLETFLGGNHTRRHDDTVPALGGHSAHNVDHSWTSTEVSAFIVIQDRKDAGKADLRSHFHDHLRHPFIPSNMTP
jgi:hypothetical protein